ncbi:LytTR family DNA-binding domain-containing protein [uncultured Chitinophaga sp.]|uniref:LytR/AlgR family response regulator transcription factor n=1 Tax=uncultured Chitinophaga sp. TaxID=339340 RepID=UPI002600DFAD|nr:LytTR family DNA-binding domain-containing protein [uncultured Chitinophaga sp.]
MQAIIVDDEKHCREVLQVLLNRYCADVEIVALCENGQEGLDAIAKHQPQLLFLDVEMPGMTGFEMLKRCTTHSFSIIFTTAYNQYAIQAIRHSALDFLLKPVDKEELADAVDKALAKRNNNSDKHVNNLMHYLYQHIQPNERLAFPTMDGLRMLAVKDITYCESDGGYTRIFMQQGEKPMLICRTLKEVEEVLGEKGFFRVHHSFMINLAYMDKYIKGDGGEIILLDGKNIPVSRNRKQEFLMRIERL